MLAIIPARGGSKGIPGKNIKLLKGKPLIAYSIEAALASRSVDRVVISTDDPEISEVASRYDVDIPFMRPKELAEDGSLAIDNYIYTINRLNEEFGNNYEDFIVLLPTSPLRTADDINRAADLFCDKKADSVISCTEMAHPPTWAKRVDDDNRVSSYFEKDTTDKNRQDVEKAYVPNGAIFILKYSLLKKNNSYYSEKTYAYLMPKVRSVDIDSPLDFNFVQYLMGQK